MPTTGLEDFLIDDLIPIVKSYKQDLEVVDNNKRQVKRLQTLFHQFRTEYGHGWQNVAICLDTTSSVSWNNIEEFYDFIQNGEEVVAVSNYAIICCCTNLLEIFYKSNSMSLLLRPVRPCFVDYYKTQGWVVF